MIEPAILIAAFLLDLVIGDPRRLPHPVRIIGKAIVILENAIRRFRLRGGMEKAAGIFLALFIVASVFIAAFSLNWLFIRAIHAGGLLMVAGIASAVALTSTTIAVKDLVDSSKAVIDSVRSGNLEEARHGLSMIVGRDTENLQDKGILKAAIETLSENLSDGIVAPLLYFAVGGFPLAMTYKAINTLDSMVGYKNERYLNLGWASARMDDIANFIPARISGMLIVLAVYLWRICAGARSSLLTGGRSFSVMIRDGRNHCSPNSGIPEAAMAGGLGVVLGGPSTYGGMLVKKPAIGDDINSDYLQASEYSLKIVLLASFLGLGLSVLIAFTKGLL